MTNRGAGFDVTVAPDGPPTRIGIIGCGRIGQMHGALVAREVPGLTLTAVADALPQAAEAVSGATGAAVMSIDELMASDSVDAVAICSSTDTHVDLVMRAAAAGRAIFCEKPVGLSLPEVDMAMAAVDAAGVPFMIGFNRRFDPGHKSVRDAVADKLIGDLHVLRITSRDPAPPPPEYVAVSGGIFLDMMIHDFDMARHVAGSEVVEVYARGAVRVDPRIGDAGDVDTTIVVLTHADGAMTAIDSSREAVYGHDQRVEAFGSGGMAVSDNPPRHSGWRVDRDTRVSEPLSWFFLDRYLNSFRLEWEAFRSYLVSGGESPAGTDAALSGTKVALAARRSWQEGRPVRMAEIT